MSSKWNYEVSKWRRVVSLVDLILTEDMIVRGNTNFTNTEVTINDKRIITEDNLEG